MSQIKPGDKVTRMLAGTIPMEGTIVGMKDGKLFFLPGDREIGELMDREEFPGWTFDAEFGYEIDEDLGWGVPLEGGKLITGSFIRESGWERDSE